jgi:hypothetical protein
VKDVGIKKPQQVVITKPSSLMQAKQQQPGPSPFGPAATAALVALPIAVLAGAAAPAAGAFLAANAFEALAVEEAIPMLVAAEDAAPMLMEYEEPLAAFENADFDFFDLDDI